MRQSLWNRGSNERLRSFGSFATKTPLLDGAQAASLGVTRRLHFPILQTRSGCIEVASTSAIHVRLLLASVKRTQRTSGRRRNRISKTGTARRQFDTTTDSSAQFRARGDRVLSALGISVRRGGQFHRSQKLRLASCGRGRRRMALGFV